MTTPREFCRQSLQVLRLPGATQPTAVGVYELLLEILTVEDPAPGSFEQQLWLLATSDACPGLSGAAAWVLEAWCAEHDREQRLARTLSCN
jgi:hypothetical protein